MKFGQKVIVACDTAIREIVEESIDILRRHGYAITDAAIADDIDDFTQSAEIVAEGIQSGAYQRGILFCGSGIGVCMAANKFHGIRAALAYDILPAAMASADQNTNVLCSGAWMMDSPEKCARMIETWLMVGYNGQDDEGIEKTQTIEENE